MPTPNYKVWVIEDFNSWRDEVWSLLGDTLTKDVKAEFLANPPEYVVSDDLEWLDDIIARVTGEFADIHSLTSERISEHYDAMRAYHGARPTNIESYYSEGLRLLDAEAFEKKAHELFLTPKYPELTAEHINKAIAAVGRDTRDGRLYFTAHKDELIGHCGHYMLYGSEYLTAIANHIDGHTDYRQHLKTFGTPTVFVCDIPLNLLRSNTIDSFAGIALAAMFEHLQDNEYSYPEPGRGGCIIMRNPVPASAIVEHFHPTGLVDPLLKFGRQ